MSYDFDAMLERYRWAGIGGGFPWSERIPRRLKKRAAKHAHHRWSRVKAARALARGLRSAVAAPRRAWLRLEERAP